jgi:hypothetical protein
LANFESKSPQAKSRWLEINAEYQVNLPNLFVQEDGYVPSGTGIMLFDPIFYPYLVPLAQRSGESGRCTIIIPLGIKYG